MALLFVDLPNLKGWTLAKTGDTLQEESVETVAPSAEVLQGLTISELGDIAKRAGLSTSTRDKNKAIQQVLNNWDQIMLAESVVVEEKTTVDKQKVL